MSKRNSFIFCHNQQLTSLDLDDNCIEVTCTKNLLTRLKIPVNCESVDCKNLNLTMSI